MLWPPPESKHSDKKKVYATINFSPKPTERGGGETAHMQIYWLENAYRMLNLQAVD